MQFKRQSKEETSVNLTPLIDVVFLLLIFFMVSTTFTDKTELQIDLPEAKGNVQIKPGEAIELVINQQGQYSINGQRLLNDNFATLKTALSKTSNGDNTLPFIIVADAQTAHQFVVTAMDAAGQLGFKNLSITTVESSQ